MLMGHSLVMNSPGVIIHNQSNHSPRTKMAGATTMWSWSWLSRSCVSACLPGGVTDAAIPRTLTVQEHTQPSEAVCASVHISFPVFVPNLPYPVFTRPGTMSCTPQISAVLACMHRLHGFKSYGMPLPQDTARHPQ